MTMRLNELSPAPGARTERTRVGRGIGSGLGKTAGRGHKGSFARKGGGKIKAGFEGGQTPMQRRLPKIGFRSKMAKDTAEVLSYQLDRLEAGEIDFAALRAAAPTGRSEPPFPTRSTTARWARSSTAAPTSWVRRPRCSNHGPRSTITRWPSTS